MAFLPPVSVKTVATIGLGAIGASWAAWFLARGYSVRGSDADPERGDFVRRYVRNAWSALSELGHTTEDSAEAALARFSFHAGPEEAALGADFVQESAPERQDVKTDLLARIDAALPSDRVIATSTSGFGVSVIGGAMKYPERLVVGHPFNPPHLIPLVEVVGGALTAPEAIETAMTFYAQTGKRPIHIRKEVSGHLANRLQAALWREAVHCVAEGVASVADVDAAIAYGPGLRWALMGPNLTFHLAGGEGGMRHFLAHLGPPVQSWWGDLGQPALTPDVAKQLIDGVDEEIGERSFADLTRERDAKLIRVLKAVS